jgi:hypothetical protein
MSARLRIAELRRPCYTPEVQSESNETRMIAVFEDKP